MFSICFYFNRKRVNSSSHDGWPEVTVIHWIQARTPLQLENNPSKANTHRNDITPKSVFSYPICLSPVAHKYTPLSSCTLSLRLLFIPNPQDSPKIFESRVQVDVHQTKIKVYVFVSCIVRNAGTSEASFWEHLMVVFLVHIIYNIRWVSGIGINRIDSHPFPHGLLRCAS